MIAPRLRSNDDKKRRGIVSLRLWIMLLLSMGCIGGLCRKYGEEAIMAWLFIFAVVGMFLSFLGFVGVSPTCQL